MAHKKYKYDWEGIKNMLSKGFSVNRVAKEFKFTFIFIFI